MNKIFLFFVIFLFSVPIETPRIIYSQPGDIQISNPEITQDFYDNLTGKPRDFFINSSQDFQLYINILVPEIANRSGIYSARVFLENNNETQIAELDGSSSAWQEIYNSNYRDYFLKGPELTKELSAGKYKIEVYSHSTGSGQADNKGEYVLVVGKKQSSGILPFLNILWQLPLLKVSFFKTSVLQFFLTPFGIIGIGIIGAVLILLALINYFAGIIRELIKHNHAKTLLLTSAGMQMKDEIKNLLQKPAYDVTVAFITTAAKPQENLDYLQRDWNIMKDEMGFNVEEVDIDGKTESQVLKLLELKDIIFVEGGNTFYLLKSMRACHFEKVIRKLLKEGKVYIGVSAGSIVAGRSIKVANKYGTGNNGNKVGLKNLKGLNLVPFDIFVHYKPENAELIKQYIPNPKKRAKNLKILTDNQAILVQGREIDLIGKGEAIII